MSFHHSMRTLRIHSNIERFGTTRIPNVTVDHRPLAPDESFSSALRNFRAARTSDAVVINTDVSRLLRWCAISLVLPRRFRLVSLDIVLGRPRTLSQRIAARVKKWLLGRVDLFLVYQHDLAGYDQFYGVSPSRSRVIPFKVNVWERLARDPLPTSDNGHLLFVGRTYRDVPTFLTAVRESGVPCMMVRHSREMAAAHGTGDVDAGQRPPNLREVVHDGDHASWLNLIAESRGIVLPIQPDVICCAGISTMLDAMALGKPVVMTECPATEGFVTTDDLALVPPADADALATALRRVSENESYRDALAARGRALAARVQGEDRLYRDVLTELTR
ncbi:MAG TPA: glycosyltransferase [Gemmatirosa sp.]